MYRKYSIIVYKYNPWRRFRNCFEFSEYANYMNCPICTTGDSLVIDSRKVHGRNSIRRRRKCTSCGFKFTTYESLNLDEQINPNIPIALSLLDAVRDAVSAGVLD